MMVTLANFNRTHQPRRYLASPSYLARSVIGAPYFFQAWSICNTRDVEMSMACTSLRDRNKGQGSNGAYTALARRTRTHADHTTHKPHAYQLLPTTYDVLYVQGTFGNLHART